MGVQWVEDQTNKEASVMAVTLVGIAMEAIVFSVNLASSKKMTKVAVTRVSSSTLVTTAKEERTVTRAMQVSSQMKTRRTALRALTEALGTTLTAEQHVRSAMWGLSRTSTAQDAVCAEPETTAMEVSVYDVSLLSNRRVIEVVATSARRARTR